MPVEAGVGTKQAVAGFLVQENFENFARENPVEASKMDQHDIVAHMTDKHGT